MSWAETEKALMQSLTGQALGFPIIQENDSQERIEKAQGNDFWFDVTNLPAATFSLDKQLSDQYNGTYQISIYGQKNRGKGLINDLVDTLVSNYKAGAVFTNTGNEVNIVIASPSKLKPDGSFVKIDLSIEYFVYVDRN